MITLATGIFVLLAIIGVILNANKEISGFGFWIISNAGLAIINFIQKNYLQSCLFLFYLGMCFYGIRQWKIKE